MRPGMAVRAGLVLVSTLAAGSVSRAAVTISSAPSENMSCSAGVCAPTATKAVLNAGDLESLLASGNATVTTTGNGVEANDIAIDAALGWSNVSALSLIAHRSITIDETVTVSGPGALSLATNGSGGTLSFGSKGSVTFQNLSSALTINGTAYTLESSVKTLASAVLANPDGAYALAGNYDAAQDGTYSNCPIDTDLTGTIEGLGNTISNLSIDAKPGRHQHAFAAFLLSIGTTGVAENLRLTGIRYTGNAAGGLAAGNDGYLFGDEVSGSINTKASAGGLLQSNYGTVVSSSADVLLKVRCCKKGESAAGGLAGINGGSIELSHASGDVSGAYGAGGLVDSNEGGSISLSYATGKVRVGGGLVYINQGTISNSYATGAVRGRNNSGGFLDQTLGGSVTSSYSVGLVGSGSGGFVCRGANFDNDYWDTTTSGTNYGACNDENAQGVTGLTTQQLQSGLPQGFDPKIWAENPKINNGLPYLINNPPVKK